MADAPKSICPNRFTISLEGHTLAFPCCWNHPIERTDQQNEQIDRLVVVVHGVVRNADEYYLNTMAAAECAGDTSNSLVIAPQFLIEEDLVSFDLSEETPFWGGETGEGWKKGDNSISTEEHPRSVQISSFEIVDRIIERVTTSGAFPNVETVVVVGHSAGGQYVNRYAVGTQIEQKLPPGISLRYIVANPSTYVYLNGERRIEGTTNDFEIPEDAEQDYNEYKYGLKALNSYMSRTSPSEMRTNFSRRDVVYLLGGEDTREAYLEQTPNAMLQGTNRLERGQIYFHYLRHLFGEPITLSHSIAIIPCVGHDHAAIFRSEAGLKYLFDVQ